MSHGVPGFEDVPPGRRDAPASRPAQAKSIPLSSTTTRTTSTVTVAVGADNSVILTVDDAWARLPRADALAIIDGLITAVRRINNRETQP
jgi:hypothetical protein